LAISSVASLVRSSGALRPLTAVAVTVLLVSFSTDALQNAIANGDTRAFSLHHMHTGESLTVTFKRDGRHDDAAIKKLNWFLRDWRRDESTTMDPHLFDLLWEVHRELKAEGPLTIISAYRSPQTNAMLRARGRGVAKSSQHMIGKAIDFYIPGVELSALREIGLRLQRGGVGFYPTSGSPFIHVDSSGVRHWPRMTREQLARVFPDGKTVHIPSDGKPMPGYELALAEIEARGGTLGPTALAARGDSTAGGEDSRLKRVFAAIFGRNDEEADEDEAGVRSNRTRLATVTVVTSTPVASGYGKSAAGPAKSTMVAALAPTPPPQGPQLQWTTGPAGVPAGPSVSATPLPRPRPADLGDLTASLPPAITGGTPERTQSAALGYAAENKGPKFGPLPATHTRIARQPEPEPRLDPARPVAASADAAKAPPTLLSRTTIEFAPELRHPDLVSLRGMVEPVRTALRAQFASDPIAAPATARFSGPAVVALQTLAFDRGTGILTGTLASRTN
jgi:uncharacterized protein YcbK (DUF882 family)